VSGRVPVRILGHRVISPGDAAKPDLVYNYPGRTNRKHEEKTMVRVKICGIKNVSDALMVLDAGADAIGLLVGQRHRSDDFLEPAQAREIVRQLPPLCSSTLVTHFSTGEEVADLLDLVPVSTVQLHSDISVPDCVWLRSRFPSLKLIKLVHVRNAGSLDAVAPYHGLVDAFLLDSINPATDQVGGTGLTHDWRISARIAASSTLPVVLAGGLRPENVAAAIAQVRPFAVDVNSGVKNAWGTKDAGKVARFIREAKNALFAAPLDAMAATA
jgi:phosphoribosylanthranilate isomerase